MLGGLLARVAGLRAPFLVGAAVVVVTTLAVSPIISNRAVRAATAPTGADRDS